MENYDSIPHPFLLHHLTIAVYNHQLLLLPAPTKKVFPIRYFLYYNAGVNNHLPHLYQYHPEQLLSNSGG